ncbi:MAG: TonB-dependent receptor [Rhodothermales bacterium]|nr:TonB-dependent receptor [Rhodothermales bacterium]
MKRLLSCTIIALVGLIPATAIAQSLSGTVSSPEGAPIPGANVIVSDRSSGVFVAGTTTDAKGTFTVDNMYGGRFLVAVSYVGRQKQIATIEISSGTDASVSIIMDPMVIPQSEMVISAKRFERSVSPATHSNLTGRELADRSSMKDLPVHLATTPSVTFYSENGNGIGYSTLRMRGFDQRRIAIAINGIPQNDPEEFNVFWINFYDIQGVVRDIQIQRGAGGAYYGSPGIGGAINIVTGPYSTEREITIETGAGSYATRQLSVAASSGTIGKKYRLYGRLSRLTSDGYRDWSWTEFWRFFGGVQRITKRSVLTLQAYGGPQRDALAYSGIPKEANKSTIDDGFGGTIDRKYNFSSFSRDLEEFHQPHFELHHHYRLTNTIEADQTLFAIKGEGFFDFDGTFRSADYLRLPTSIVDSSMRTEPLFVSRPDVSVLFRAYLDQWQAGWYPRLTFRGDLGTTTIGSEFRLHRSTRWGRIQESNLLPTDLVGDSNVRVYQFRGQKTIASVLASHVIRPASTFLVQGDISVTHRRYRIFDEEFFGTSFRKPYIFVNPRLGVTINPDKRLSGYVSTAITSREPRMKSLYDGEEAGAGFVPQFETMQNGSFDYDNPFVKPERMFNIEAGLNRRDDRYQASVNSYVMYFVDEIVPSGGLDQFGVPRTGNADETIHVGVEAEIGARLTRRVDVQGNTSISRNRFIKFTEYDPFTGDSFDRSGNSIAGFPDVTANATLSYSRSGATFRWTTQLVGRQFIDNANGRTPNGESSAGLKVDPYVLADATVNYRFQGDGILGGLSASLDVNNVFNSNVLMWGNVSFGAPQYFPYATRHIYFKLRYQLG